MDPLDNPFWHALLAQAEFAVGDEHARRYRPDVTPIAALPDKIDPNSWDTLARLTDEPDGINLLRPSYDVPEGWTIHHRRPIIQMFSESIPDRPEGYTFLDLGPSDRQEMLELVTLTQPGPYAINAPDLGPYIGIREGGRLIAMAGERIHLDGMTEITAVCTHPDQQGRGLGAAITAELTARIYQRGEQPFLHAAASNPGPQRIYRRLGFRTLRTLEHLVASPPA